MVISEFDAASAYAHAWNTLDCSGFIALLAPDASYASQYVLSELSSRDDIAAYLTGKMETVKQSGLLVRGELAKASRGFYGKDCVALFQGDMDDVAAVVVFTVDGSQIARFDLCIAQLYGPMLSGVFPGLKSKLKQ